MKNISLFFAALVAVLFSVAETSAQITPPYYNPANVNITGGNINGTVIGGTTPAAGTHTTLKVSGNNAFPGALGSNGQGYTYSNNADGMVLYGRGSTSDFLIVGRTGSQVLKVGASSVNAEFGGTLYTINTTDSSSTTTGALRTAGGLGVAKKAYFGDSLNSAKDIKFTSSNLGAATDYYIGNYLTNLVYNAPTGSGHNWAINNNDTMALNASGLTIANGKTLQVGSGSTTSAGLIAGYLGVSGYGALWSTGVTPSTTNYAFTANANDSLLNAGTTTALGIGGTLKLTVTSSNISHSGNMIYDKTITAAGTTGAVTINKTTGRVNFAAAATSLVVTNSLATANSICHVTKATNDATMRLGACVAAAGSITIYADVAPAAETAVNFTITN